MTERRIAGAGVALAIAVLIAGCASGPGAGRDGAPARPPPGLDRVQDAEPRVEPIRSSGGTSKPYTVLGRGYTPITDDRPLRETGLASWYGSKFHGQPTASGERYDMYAMTAAHKTLPLPSYVRVRNPANGREAIVRVNDRGPFHADRVIDLSYTAALQLDLLRGVAPVEIERITNEDIRTGTWRRDSGTAVARTQPPRNAGAEGARSTASADGAVVVPSAWALPVASVGAETIPVAPPASLAPPAPMSTPPSAVGAGETTPRGLVVTPLPPMAPAVEAAASPSSTAAQAAPTPARPPVADAEGIAGFWVQLGAFRERAGAEQLLAQASRSVPPLAARLTVFSEAGTHRLQVGPYPSREAAGIAVAQVRDGLGIAPLVVERR